MLQEYESREFQVPKPIQLNVCQVSVSSHSNLSREYVNNQNQILLKIKFNTKKLDFNTQSNLCISRGTCYAHRNSYGDNLY